jgi:hypothetical protein
MVAPGMSVPVGRSRILPGRGMLYANVYIFLHICHTQVF